MQIGAELVKMPIFCILLIRIDEEKDYPEKGTGPWHKIMIKK